MMVSSWEQPFQKSKFRICTGKTRRHRARRESRQSEYPKGLSVGNTLAVLYSADNLLMKSQTHTTIIVSHETLTRATHVVSAALDFHLPILTEFKSSPLSQWPPFVKPKPNQDDTVVDTNLTAAGPNKDQFTRVHLSVSHL
jgi:hypothetical protein